MKICAYHGGQFSRAVIFIGLSLTSACDMSGGVSEYGESIKRSGAAVIQTAATEPFAYQIPQPSRPTPGQNAKNQVNSLSLGGGEELGILLLPVIVPLAAAYGAATAPDDNEWAATLAQHRAENDRLAQMSAPYVRIARSVDSTAIFNRSFREALINSTGSAISCVAGPGLDRNCPNSGAAPRLHVALESYIAPVPARGSRILFTTEAKVTMTLPDRGQMICRRYSITSGLLRSEGGGTAQRGQIRAHMERQYRSLAEYFTFRLLQDYTNTAGTTGRLEKLFEPLGQKLPGISPIENDRFMGIGAPHPRGDFRNLEAYRTCQIN